MPDGLVPSVDGEAPTAVDRLALIERWSETFGLDLRSEVEAALAQQEAEHIAGLVATAQAAALRDYADQHHHFGGGHGPGWAGTEPVDADAWCACGASWDEEGCTERGQLLDDARRIESGERG